MRRSENSGDEMFIYATAWLFPSCQVSCCICVSSCLYSVMTVIIKDINTSGRTSINIPVVVSYCVCCKIMSFLMVDFYTWQWGKNPSCVWPFLFPRHSFSALGASWSSVDSCRFSWWRSHSSGGLPSPPWHPSPVCPTSSCCRSHGCCTGKTQTHTPSKKSKTLQRAHWV